MMKYYYLFGTIILWLLITTTTTSSSKVVSPRFAKLGCQEKCGDITIPYPFGMGSSNCFLNKWFEISCDNNSSNPHFRAFLKHTQLPIFNISKPNDYGQYDFLDRGQYQWVQVGYPISFSSCPNKTNIKDSIDLADTPFFYSSRNYFVAVSTCGAFAKYKTRRGNMLIEYGCGTTTNSNYCLSNNSTMLLSSNIDFNNCNGIECCMTPSTSDDKNFEISIDRSNMSYSECKYAFLIDKNEMGKYKIFRHMDYAPVRLSWIVNTTLFNNYKTHINSFKCYYWNNNMMGISSTMNLSSDLGFCLCQHGFRGNPYIVDGCQDINECDEHDDGVELCPGSTCVNTFGGFNCSYKRKFIFIGLGSGFGVLVLVFGTWKLYKFIKKRNEIKRKKIFFKRNGGLLLKQQIHSSENNVEQTKLFDSKELEKATNNFSMDRILGHGGQGTVYKGMLKDGRIVAIKKSKIIDEAKLSEFINEVVILTQINHRNVVKLLGCCLETDVPLLVYEFIPNGTLSEYIHERNAEFSFTWNMRLRIATEIARALSYLHSAASFPIYHRDVKSTNILLDEKFRAKVADFGTSRTISLEQTHLTTLVYGTFGYLDPEYFQSSQFTDKSDVYSFGVVLVELLTGQKAISTTRSEEGRSLATYFIMTMEQKSSSLFDIIDDQVLKNVSKDEILIVANLAQRCLHLSGRNRPTMKEVAMELEMIKMINKDAKDSQHNDEELELICTT